MTTKQLYDFLRWVALIGLPAAGALYFTVGQIWNFPAIEQVVGTVAALDTFLGLVIRKSSKDYENSLEKPEYKGDIVVKQDEDGEVMGMKFIAAEDPLILPHGKQVIFDVKRELVIHEE